MSERMVLIFLFATQLETQDYHEVAEEVGQRMNAVGDQGLTSGCQSGRNL